MGQARPLSKQVGDLLRGEPEQLVVDQRDGSEGLTVAGEGRRQLLERGPDVRLGVGAVDVHPPLDAAREVRRPRAAASGLVVADGDVHVVDLRGDHHTAGCGVVPPDGDERVERRRHERGVLELLVVAAVPVAAQALGDRVARPAARGRARPAACSSARPVRVRGR